MKAYGSISRPGSTWVNSPKKKFISYRLKNKDNGVYVFVLEGKATVAGQELGKRDGLEVSESSSISFEVENGTKLLLMEVPMNIEY